MASYDDLCAAIEECSLPFARIMFDPDDQDGIPQPPFVILMPQRTSNRMGSNHVVAQFDQYDVELYTRGSDMGLEERVESALKAHGFAFQRDTTTPGDGIAETIWSTYCDR